MGVLAILIGIVFWSIVISIWLLVSRKASKKTRTVGAILVLIVPTIGLISEMHREVVQEPLFKAAQNGDVSRIKVQLALGADVDAVSEGGQTALAWAVANNHPEAVRVLLAQNANPIVVDSFSGSTLLSETGKSSDHTIANLLRQAGARDRSPGDRARAIGARSTGSR